MDYYIWGKSTLNIPQKMWVRTEKGHIIKKTLTPNGRLANYKGQPSIKITSIKSNIEPHLNNDNNSKKSLEFKRNNEKIVYKLMNSSEKDIKKYIEDLKTKIFNTSNSNEQQILRRNLIEILFLLKLNNQYENKFTYLLDEERKNYHISDFHGESGLIKAKNDAKRILKMTDEEVKKEEKYDLKNDVEFIEFMNSGKKKLINFDRNNIKSNNLKTYLKRYLPIKE